VSWGVCDQASSSAEEFSADILLSALELTVPTMAEAPPITGGSKTLRHISFLEWSSTFFFRFTFCAMDSVHLFKILSETEWVENAFD
jgi:hypothetical protein